MNTLMNIHHARAHRKQRGIAAVELTIALPLLLLLMFSAGEVGRLIYQYNTLTKAVEDGARYLASRVRAANTASDLTTLEAEAINLVRYGNTAVTATPLLPGTVSVTPDTSATGINEITLTATYTYDPIVFPDSISFPMIPTIQLAVPLTATVGMPRL
jgi:Flp pilus assembly protein TadG